jgi:hypothetical protein
MPGHQYHQPGRKIICANVVEFFIARTTGTGRLDIGLKNSTRPTIRTAFANAAKD